MTPLSPQTPVKVLVVEDDSFTRQTLVATLRGQGFDVVGDSGIAGDAHQLAQLTRPHVAVLDLHLGDGPTGIDLARALRRDNPNIGVVILTSYEDPRMLSTSIPEAPAGTQYVTKKSVESVGNLVQAIRVSVTSHVVKPTRITKSVIGQLTNTQLEVLRLIAEGHSNQQIAENRGISIKSLEGTISRLLKALDIPVGTAVNQRVLLARSYFEAAGLPGHD